MVMGKHPRLKLSIAPLNMLMKIANQPSLEELQIYSIGAVFTQGLVPCAAAMKLHVNQKLLFSASQSNTCIICSTGMESKVNMLATISTERFEPQSPGAMADWPTGPQPSHTLSSPEAEW